MDLEAWLRNGADLANLSLPVHDPMLVAYIRAIDIFWAFKRGVSPAHLEPRLAELAETDLAAAVREFLSRPRAREH
jgi:hypothetical protein